MLPGIQPAFRAVEEPMGAGGHDTADVEIDDESASAAREDDALIEGVAALCIEYTEVLQEIARIALSVFYSQR